MKKFNTIRILGINFFNGTPQQVVNILKQGGLLVVPAAPALINIRTDSDYYKSLLAADIVIPDSGYMSLIWNLFHKRKINRISGLQFLITFLQDQEVKHTFSIMLVNPNQKETESNLTYLNSKGFGLRQNACYLAPIYNKKKVKDATLLKIIEDKKPAYIIINLGGGIQEKLGAYLKRNLTYKPAIICTGAAIAFLTGQQAKIPQWADKCFMGWLFRCFKSPKVYVPRYFKAFNLINLILQYEKNAPA